MWLKLSFPLTVREDVPEGTVIATVHATDLDNSPNAKNAAQPVSSIVSNYLAYFISQGNDAGHFKINERGELSIWRGLDFEQEQRFELTIVATDGYYTDNSNVTVNLIDVNGKFNSKKDYRVDILYVCTY